MNNFCFILIVLNISFSFNLIKKRNLKRYLGTQEWINFLLKRLETVGENFLEKFKSDKKKINQLVSASCFLASKFLTKSRYLYYTENSEEKIKEIKSKKWVKFY